MIKSKTAIKIRKAHRYLGLFLGIQDVLPNAQSVPKGLEMLMAQVIQRLVCFVLLPKLDRCRQ